jgi:hypothetical protein
MFLSKLSHVFLTNEFVFLYWLVFSCKIYQEVLNESYWVPVWSQSSQSVDILHPVPVYSYFCNGLQFRLCSSLSLFQIIFSGILKNSISLIICRYHLTIFFPVLTVCHPILPSVNIALIVTDKRNIPSVLVR